MIDVHRLESSRNFSFTARAFDAHCGRVNVGIPTAEFAVHHFLMEHNVIQNGADRWAHVGLPYVFRIPYPSAVIATYCLDGIIASSN